MIPWFLTKVVNPISSTIPQINPNHHLGGFPKIGVALVIFHSSTFDWDFPVHKNHPGIGETPSQDLLHGCIRGRQEIRLKSNPMEVSEVMGGGVPKIIHSCGKTLHDRPSRHPRRPPDAGIIFRCHLWWPFGRYVSEETVGDVTSQNDQHGNPQKWGCHQPVHGLWQKQLTYRPTQTRPGIILGGIFSQNYDGLIFLPGWWGNIIVVTPFLFPL